MDKQAIFNKVIRFLDKQGARAVQDVDEDTAACQYRAKNGLKCAVGCLIPDDRYQSIIEGSSLRSVLYRYADVLVGRAWPTDEELVFYRDLQLLHDRKENWELLEGENVRRLGDGVIAHFAAKYSLTVPERA